MPYVKVDELPDVVKALPRKAQDIWMSEFNSSHEDGKSENESIQAAWGKVREEGYIKNAKGKWVKASAGDAPQVLSIFTEINFEVPEEATEETAEGVNVSIPILRKSKFTHPWYGDMDFDDEFFTLMLNNFYADTLGFEPSMDVAHEPDLGAIGWIKEVKYEDETLTLLPNMLDEGLELIKSGKFKYASISMDRNYVDAETGQAFGPVLMGAALTNRPFIHRQEAVSLLSMDGLVEDLPTSFILFEQTELDNTDIQEEIVEKIKEKQEDVQLDATSTPDVVSLSQEDFEALQAQVADLEAQAEKTKGLEGERDALSTQIVALQSKYEQAENEKILGAAASRIQEGMSLAPVVIDFAAKLLNFESMGTEDSEVELSADFSNMREWARSAVSEMVLSFPYTLPVDSNDTEEKSVDNPSQDDLEASEAAMQEAIDEMYDL